MKTKTAGLNTYRCGGFRDCQAETIRAAGYIFAERAARRAYGPNGEARTLNTQSYATDGTGVEFQAFIGKTTQSEGTTGHNITFTVYEVNHENT